MHNYLDLKLESAHSWIKLTHPNESTKFLDLVDLLMMNYESQC